MTMGAPNVTDVLLPGGTYFQPGTDHPVANNLVTYLFEAAAPTRGSRSVATVGGTGAIADEVYWRDANANGTIGADEARGFADGRANFVLRLEGNVIPEPASIGLLGLTGVALLRRRRGI